MAALYNEIDPFAATWIENLIASQLITPGTVDRRSIKELRGDDLTDFQRVHLFAGIAGWEEALRLAAWPTDVPIWTGSCPCQPFSQAGKRKGKEDERHLWPEMFRLIGECRPATVVGEQVAGPDGLKWLDGVFADLEGIGYACGAANLPCASVGAPHIRQRLFWCAYRLAISDNIRHDGWQDSARTCEQRQHHKTEAGSGCGGLADTNRTEFRGEPHAGQQPLDEQDGGSVDRLEHSASDGRIKGRTESERGSVASGCSEVRVVGVGNPDNAGSQGRTSTGCARELLAGPTGLDRWSDFSIAHCTDGKSRRFERGSQPLAHGLPRNMGRGQPELSGLVRRARANRTGRLRGYGNAINPVAAAVFLMAAQRSLLTD